MIHAEHLNFSYDPQRTILADISFDVSAGQVLGIMGPNGSGKTTLLKLLLGDLKPGSGQVTVDRKIPAGLSLAERAHVWAYVPAEEALPAAMRVRDYAALGRTPHMNYWGYPSPHDLAVLAERLQDLQCADFAQQTLGALSSGELQRVRLCRALVQETPGLVLDEPASHLDLTQQRRILDYLARFAHTHGLTVVLTLHQPWQARVFCDRVLLLTAQGQLAGFGPPAEVLTPGLLSHVFDIDEAFARQA